MFVVHMPVQIMMLVLLLMINVIMQIIHAQQAVLDVLLWDFAILIKHQQLVQLPLLLKQLKDANGLPLPQLLHAEPDNVQMEPTLLMMNVIHI